VVLASTLAALVIGGIVAAPLFQRAISYLSLPLAYAPQIRAQATADHLDPALIAAVIYAETRFEPRTSSAGAEGLMQLEPMTAEFLAHRTGGISFRVADLAHPAVNIAYGSYYLRYLLNEYHGDVILALAAYNGGETNVDRWLVREGGPESSFTARDIPFPQTRAYVEKVLAAVGQYRRTYRTELGL
jgi:soluble lytic murein transglycosylase